MRFKKHRARLVVSGNAQAHAITEALEQSAEITERFDLQYLPLSELDCGDRYDLLFLQVSGHDHEPAVDAQVIVRFPNLHLALLWPLGCVNPYDAVEEPAFPHGRFPYGDSYVVNCVQKGTDAKDILAFCTGRTWPATWPDLNRLFIAESARLAALDNACDVKVSSYILKHFAKRRLFSSPNGPSQQLLAIVANRLIQHLLGHIQPAVPTFHMAGIQTDASRNFLERVEVPVHDAIAAHFRLEWHESEARYAYFGELLSADEYFARMISHSYAMKARGRD